MNAIIENILKAAGDMPNPAAHRRYLESLPTAALEARLKELHLTSERRSALPVYRPRPLREKAMVPA